LYLRLFKDHLAAISDAFLQQKADIEPEDVSILVQTLLSLCEIMAEEIWLDYSMVKLRLSITFFHFNAIII